MANIAKKQVLQIEISPEIRENPELIRRELSPNLLLMLDYILKLKLKYRIIYISQARIAHDLGFSRGYVNRCIRELKSMGFLQTKFRDYNTCLYFISDFFNDDLIRSKLRHIFSAFKILSISLLLNHAPSAAITPYNIRLFKDIYKDNYTTKNIVQNIMSSLSNKNQIPFAIRDLAKDLGIEPYKLLDLSHFPDEAIKFLRKQLAIYKPNISPDKQLNYYFVVCKNYCIENNLPIDYQHGYRLKFFLGDSDLRSLKAKDNDRLIPSFKISSQIEDLPSRNIKTFTKEEKMDNEFLKLFPYT